MLDSDSLLAAQLDRWHEKGIGSIAMDFEGEFNLHIYGEHLCLVQIFDGLDYFLVDPFVVSEKMLRRLLEDESLEKVMFDCSSDAALVRKQYGITLKPVYDVRVSAKLLDFNGNLSSLVSRCLNTPPVTGKKGNQTANWLRRPLQTKLIEYALSDVEHLFAIRSVLEKELKNAGLLGKAEEMMKTVSLPKGPDKYGWEKLNGYRYLSKEQKIYVKWFFEARDMLARKLNKPAFQVLDKHVLVAMAKQVPQDGSAFRSVVSHKNRQIEDDMIALLMVAREGAIDEIGSVK
jgi:ribonuclease D